MKLFATKPEKDRGTLQAVGVSTLAHALLIALLVVLSMATTTTHTSGMLTLAGTGGGGGGGGSGETIHYIGLVQPAAEPARHEAPEPPAVVPTPEPVAEPVKPPDVIPPVVAATAPLGRAMTEKVSADSATGSTGVGTGAGAGTGTGPGSGSGNGGGHGSGNGTGIGSGSGPGVGGGDGAGGAPVPRMLLLPPAAPAALRGSSVTVELAVDSAGAVREVRLRPPTGNSKFDDALRRAALEWRFRPGTDAAGHAAAKLFEVVFSF